jgi:hypothetical protein
LVATKWTSVKNHRVNFVYFFTVICIQVNLGEKSACIYFIYMVLV